MKVRNVTIQAVQGDICESSAEAIVNAANNRLWMGGGVAGAIKRRGGIDIEREAVGKGPVIVGEAIVTGAGSLRAKWVIHAAVMEQDLVTDAHKIRLATRNALRRASELGVSSIALPALGTGVGGFPVDVAARIMVEEAARHAALNEEPSLVQFVLFSSNSKAAFDRAMSDWAEKHMR
ncbi:MAG: macro domain-containing protein [Thermoplasmata archaeon]